MCHFHDWPQQSLKRKCLLILDGPQIFIPILFVLSQYVVFQSVLYGLKNSLKTVVVISPEFLLTTWNYCDLIIGELDAESLKNDLVCLRAIHTYK